MVSQVCARTLCMMEAATGAWTVASNSVWPRSFRLSAREAMLVAQRRRAANAAAVGGAGELPPPQEEVEGGGRQLNTLTPELWERVLGFCHRRWFLRFC